MTTETETTGTLEGPYNYGCYPPNWHMQCVDCKTAYPLKSHKWIREGWQIRETNVASCNGVEITKCPWCRPDKSGGPYAQGR